MAGTVTLQAAREPHALDVVAGLVARVWPGEDPDPAALRRWLEVEPSPLLLLAWLDDEAVGTGWGSPGEDPVEMPAMIRVVREARGRGVGSALFAAISEHGRRLGRSEVRGRVRETDSADVLPWLERRGFRVLDRRFESVLHLAEAPDAPAAALDGVELVTLAARPELARAAYALEAEATPDIPTAATIEVASYERWRAQTVDDPSFLAAGSFVALADGEPIGMATLGRDGRSNRGYHQMTAVRRSWRGRGVAVALKRAQIAWARTSDLDALATDNDESNVAMRGINDRLGYRPENVELVVRGPLA